MKVIASVVVSMASIFVIPLASTAAEPPTVRAVVNRVQDRKPAPNFKLEDGSGKSATVSDYRGRVLLLNFWATWCGGCKKEIPWFQEFATKLDPTRFAVLGVSVDDEGWAAVKPYVQKTGVTYRMVVADKSMPERYAVTSMPATFLIDREGRIAATYVGVVDRGDIETNINVVLGEHQN